MVYFNCDYMAGAHPEVLETLSVTNSIKTVGYGADPFTMEAKRVILDSCGLKDGDVFFLQGGTQTNKVVIDRLLNKNDGVICCESAHINVHEAGAIEADGHKVMPLPSSQGKITSEEIRKYMLDFVNDETKEHMVRPAMVYISHPTEFGTIYSKEELSDISSTCKEFQLPLYIDGARLAYGLAASGNNISLQDLASMADVFYIGGTKCGALFGEAVVTKRPDLFPRFMSLMKLHGALLAKGRILAVQFIALFKDNLYLRIGEHADRLANRLKKGLIDKGYKTFIDSPTNQQFFILPNEVIDRLETQIGFELWGPKGESDSRVRFVTDWSTSEGDIDTLLNLI